MNAAVIILLQFLLDENYCFSGVPSQQAPFVGILLLFLILHHDTIHLARIRCACVDGNHMRAVVRREIGIGAKCRTFSLIF